MTRIAAAAVVVSASLALACGMEWQAKFFQDMVILGTETLVANNRNAAKSSEHDATALRSFAVSPDGQLIALLNKKAGRLRINDVSGTKSVMVFENRAPQLFTWAGDSVGFAMLEAARDGKARVTLADVKAKTSREVQLGDVRPAELAFAQDGKTLLVVSTVKGQLWSVGSGEPKLLLERKQLHALTVGPRLVALADDANVLTLDLTAAAPKPQVVHSFKPSEAVTALEWTADGDALFIGRGANIERLVPGKPAERIGGVMGATHTLARSPDGKLVAAASDRTLAVFERGGKFVYEASGGSAVRWRRDGSALVVAYEDSIIELDPVLWSEDELSSGLPFASKFESAQMALLSPDFLGDKLVYSLFRVAGKEVPYEE